ncbi:MAG: hypothetical protein VSS75_006910 [Candidatus Parabeggiatoa sp.]|nr:hypothetical protein [Candidatus Parabeggiatoa sp.]
MLSGTFQGCKLSASTLCYPERQPPVATWRSAKRAERFIRITLRLTGGKHEAQRSI